MRFSEFKQQLYEEAAGKNVHIEHVEDLIFNKGYAGINEALNYVEGIRRMLKPGSGSPGRITVKYDGAPAIICGLDPADGKFFIGTKSVFGVRQPKLIKKSSDIQRFYSAQPDLAKKLTVAFKYLKTLGIGGVLQGDFMFDSDSKVIEEIDGQEMITFTPNTITYAVPLNSESGKRIAAAKLGIIFHTQYDGESIENMKPSFDVNVANLNKSSSVWFDNAAYKNVTGLATLTDEENAQIVRKMETIKSAASKIQPGKVNSIVNHPELGSKFKPFVNSLVRQNKTFDDALAFVKEFLNFYESTELTGMEKLKSGPMGPAYQKRLKKLEAAKKFAENNLNTMIGIIAIYKNLVELKLEVISKLRQVEGLGAFIKTPNGYRVTNQEGFVAVGRRGSVVKFIDRLDFSRENFTATRNWKK